MSNQINVNVERTVTEWGGYRFSSEHDPDLVEKWIDDKGSNCWDIDNWETTYEQDSFIESVDVSEGDGDYHCHHDDEIQKWKDENTLDMNQIFSSGCDVQLITNFINENENLFNSLCKKNCLSEMTLEEQKVFKNLKKLTTKK